MVRSRGCVRSPAAGRPDCGWRALAVGRSACAWSGDSRRGRCSGPGCPPGGSGRRGRAASLSGPVPSSVGAPDWGRRHRGPATFAPGSLSRDGGRCGLGRHHRAGNEDRGRRPSPPVRQWYGGAPTSPRRPNTGDASRRDVGGGRGPSPACLCDASRVEFPAVGAEAALGGDSRGVRGSGRHESLFRRPRCACRRAFFCAGCRWPRRSRHDGCAGGSPASQDDAGGCGGGPGCGGPWHLRKPHWGTRGARPAGTPD